MTRPAATTTTHSAASTPCARAGDRIAAARELARLRTTLGAPARYLPLELRELLAAGDVEHARPVFERMLPAERTLAALAAVGTGDKRARDAFVAAAAGAADAPGALGPLLRAAGDDPAASFDGRADQLAAEDRAHPILPNAATAVLAHTETYDLTPAGLLHWVLFDVRRVSGTTDVEENAQAPAPQVVGRSALRALRRRILKKDGRVMEPEQTPHAAQEHADLSQLEQGDVVEAVYEGWALPGDTAQVGVDTPDLLPERVAVHDATIEVRLPSEPRRVDVEPPAARRGDDQGRRRGARAHLARGRRPGPSRRGRDPAGGAERLRQLHHRHVGRLRPRAARDGGLARRPRPRDRGVGAQLPRERAGRRRQPGRRRRRGTSRGQGPA